MNTKAIIQYSIVALGVIVGLVAGVRWLWPAASEEPLSPPQALSAVLSGPAPTVEKVRAAQQILRHGEAARSEARAAIAAYSQHEPAVMAPLLQATAKNKDYRSMPTLLELLDHPEPLVRGRAGAAIQKIMGADYGFRANAPPEERAPLVAAIRTDYQMALPRLQEVYSAQTP